jgi:hypothetical protein
MALSDPFVLDGKLALAVVTQLRTAPPDAAMLDRLTLDGYAAWLASARSKATITRSDNPLPELAPSASPTPSFGLPSVRPAQTAQPTGPLLPAGTPVPTDALGLPLLP